MTEKKDKRTKAQKYTCFYCEKDYVEANYYKTYSKFFSNIGRIPYCKQCIEKFYQEYLDEYKNAGSLTPERDAVKRVCMAMDLYFSEDNYNSSMDKIKKDGINTSPMGQYMRTIFFKQYQNKSYDKTIEEENKKALAESLVDSYNISDSREVDEETVKFFGAGFTDEDYEFLKDQYGDWVTRHECQTKAQEEVFKRICFKQLEILKATRRGEDTKNLDDTFQKLLDTAKLQPKQNSNEAMSDAQTFGTLIDKWENTRPIPEVEDELKDVDKIGYLIHVFFTGHMARVLNLGSSLSNLYDKYIKKFTVEKNLNSGESDNEVLFDKIFGKKNIDEQDI